MKAPPIYPSRHQTTMKVYLIFIKLNLDVTITIYVPVALVLNIEYPLTNQMTGYPETTRKEHCND